MKLLLINPNTTQAMTDAIAEAARAVASPGTEIVAVQPSFGPVSIESHYDEAFAAAGVAEQVRLAAAWRPDAVVIACFGDPGLEAAREATDAPVLGIAEPAFHAAGMLATGFSVITTMTRTCIMAERLLQRYGADQHCRGVHGTDIPVLDLEGCGVETLQQIEDAAREALARDRSGAIVLGCAGMAPLCATLSQRLGVPVIDGVAVAAKFAEALVGLGLRTSKHGDYAPPLPKPFVGWASPLRW
ncbi:aspartate/glutamate racemase family protein [Hydrogenophaga atypica]|uniref:Aspartate/glutamate racemase family protein n=1 Tax=Hydrogenophaga atypica TaxID=249409 RepID=A0ABW2QD64_9BURK